MIPYDKIIIKKFTYIDRMGDGLAAVVPQSGVKFIGRRDDDYYIQYVEDWINGELVHTINCEEISDIWFE